jgi:4-amino-4-deoxy-L-arabinose transferase-like glycosyltransferase
LRRGLAYPVLIAACTLPRLAVLVHERGAALGKVEKSDIIARVFLHSGTFGYVPGEPSAYTQPMYGWFLIAVYWLAGRHWWSLGSVQIMIAVATVLLVYEIGRRFLSPRAGLVGALIATLQPYLVWHDVHGNREILDQLLGAAVFGLALAARTPTGAAALGAVSGLAILSNTRLVLLPIALGVYLLWRRRGYTAALAVPILAGVVLVPWVVRNKVEVGCFAITTDARALWKANNLGTYETLRKGGWIDAVPDIPERRGHVADRWRTPQEAHDIYVRNHHKIAVDECMQQGHYEHLVLEFWKKHPGAKAKLMVQATRMLWDPRVGSENSPGLASARKFVEPLYVVPLYLLALVGLLFVPVPFRVLALIFAGYETLATWVFAGTTRYRVPWDFVLALLAAAAIERVPLPRAPFRRPLSQKR